jgi:ABC-type sugar transport system ATPase subunit
MASAEFERVCKKFGDTVALDEFSLRVAHGELITVLGPSGCGKSTLLRLTAGLESPTAGSIRLGMQRIDTLPPHRRNVAMVFQNYALYPHMTVRANIEFPLRMRPATRRRCSSSPPPNRNGRSAPDTAIAPRTAGRSPDSDAGRTSPATPPTIPGSSPARFRSLPTPPSRTPPRPPAGKPFPRPPAETHTAAATAAIGSHRGDPIPPASSGSSSPATALRHCASPSIRTRPATIAGATSPAFPSSRRLSA